MEGKVKDKYVKIAKEKGSKNEHNVQLAKFLQAVRGLGPRTGKQLWIRLT